MSKDNAERAAQPLQAVPAPNQTPLEQKILRIKAGQKLKATELKRLTMPLFSMSHTPMMVCLMLGEIKEAEFIIDIPGKPDSKPQVIHCLNADDGIEGLLIVNAIMASALKRDGKPLTGRAFKFVAHDIREGKKYRDVEVIEIDLQ